MPTTIRTAWMLSLLVPLTLALARCDSEPPSQTVAASPSFVPLADCPVTRPNTPYVGREPYLAAPPEYYKSVWYGTDALWTMLDPEGEVWAGLPNTGGKFTQKTWWWSRNFEIEPERRPAITVTGTRLDAPGGFTAGDRATHGYADFGNAMLVGIDIPGAGCWKIRADYKGASLVYVVVVQ